jgi:hypothetical protein
MRTDSAERKDAERAENLSCPTIPSTSARRAECSGDEAGCDLPGLWEAEDPAMTEAIWHEIFAKQLRLGELLINTDVTDHVLFLSGL